MNLRVARLTIWLVAIPALALSSTGDGGINTTPSSEPSTPTPGLSSAPTSTSSSSSSSLSSSASSSDSLSTSGAFITNSFSSTSGPESTLRRLSMFPAAVTKNDTDTVKKLTDDLAESQSSESQSILHRSGNSLSDYQNEQYKQYLASLKNEVATQVAQLQQQHQQQPNGESMSAAPQSNSASAARTVQDLQTTASTHHQRQQLTELPVSNELSAPKSETGVASSAGGIETGKLTAQQMQHLMSGRAGHFTLVSNQQISPNHVTMIGYTTPIIKMGGFIKPEQLQQAVSSAAPTAASAHQPSPSPSSAGQLPVSSAAPESVSLPAAGSGATSASSESSAQYNYSPQLTQMTVAQYRQAIANMNAAAAASQNSLISQAELSQALSQAGQGAVSSIAPEKSLPMKMEAQSPIASVAEPGQTVRMFYSDKYQQPMSQSSAPQYMSQAKLSPYAYRMVQAQVPTPISAAAASASGMDMKSAQMLASQQSSYAAPAHMSQGPHFASPLEKPKPFLVYKPGYMDKVRALPVPSAAHTGNPSGHVPQYHTVAPSSLPETAMRSFLATSNPASGSGMTQAAQAQPSYGQKLTLEKQSNLRQIMPLGDVESNDIMALNFDSQKTGSISAMASLGMPPVSPISGSLRHHSAMSVVGTENAPPMSPLSFAQPRPIMMPKQIEQPAISGNHYPVSSSGRPQILSMSRPRVMGESAFSAPRVMTEPAYRAMRMMQRPQQAMQLQNIPQPIPQPPLSSESFSYNPQAPTQVMEQPMPQMISQQISSQPSADYAPKMRVLDQNAGKLQMPAPEVSSKIFMPESNSKVDPTKELEDQINFVLQNSPNLSENSRNRHRPEIAKAVQESMGQGNQLSRAHQQFSAPPSSHHQHSVHQAQYQSAPSHQPMRSVSPISSAIPQQTAGTGRPVMNFEVDAAGNFAPIGQPQQSAPTSSALVPSYSRESIRSISESGSPKYTERYMQMTPQVQYASPRTHGSIARHTPESSTYERYNQETSSPMYMQNEQMSAYTPKHSPSSIPKSNSVDFKASLQKEIQNYLQDQIQKTAAAPMPMNIMMNAVGQTQSSVKYQNNPSSQTFGAAESYMQAQASANQELKSAPTSSSASIVAHSTPSSKMQSTTSVSPAGTLSTEQLSKQAYSQLLNHLSTAQSIQPDSKTMRSISEWWKESSVVSKPSLMAYYQAAQ